MITIITTMAENDSFLNHLWVFTFAQHETTEADDSESEAPGECTAPLSIFAGESREKCPSVSAWKVAFIRRGIIFFWAKLVVHLGWPVVVHNCSSIRWVSKFVASSCEEICGYLWISVVHSHGECPVPSSQVHPHSEAPRDHPLVTLRGPKILVAGKSTGFGVSLGRYHRTK